ncbi:E3 SUMO-protein ligase ZBED1-like [Haematobia irritans]|uniref:E3 SUMO-protein ligase ZBED1-like n=1 Tax=Haematobia irritans TaxID=7368 RepID=UPI003F4F5BFC
MSDKRKTSPIWKHFVEIGKDRAQCKYCKNSLSTVYGSIGNLSRHMKRKHPATPINTERQMPSLVQVLESCDDEVQCAISTTTPHTTENATGGATNCSSPKANRKTQPNITQFLQRPPPTRKVEKIDLQILKMIVKGHHSFRIVEEPEFKALLELVSRCPNYRLPSRKKISNALLLSSYNDVLEEVKTKIQTASAIVAT